MKQQKLKWFDWLFLGIAVICAAALLCPYSVLKSIGNEFASDGNMERITPELVLIFRIVMAFVCAVMSGMILWRLLAADSRTSFFTSLAALPGRCVKDASPFFKKLFSVLDPHDKKFLIMMLLFAAGTILRVMQINAPLLHDEAYSMSIWARSDVLFAISDYHLPNNHVFHSLLLNLIYHHLGKSVWMLRLPVLISGCLLIPAVWLLGKQFYDDAAALTAAGLTAFGPFLISYSFNARGYEMQAFFSVITVGLAVFGKRHRNVFSWFLLIIISGLNFFTLPIALYPFGGICIWLFLNVIFFDPEGCAFKNRWQLFKYLIFMGLSVSALSMLLYVPLLRFSGWNSFFGNIYIGGVEKEFFIETMLSRLTDNIHAFTDTLPKFVMAGIAFGLVLSPFVFRKISREKVSYGLALVLWMGIVIPFQRPNLWPRTLLFLHPFLLLFCASGLMGLFRQLRIPQVGMCVCAVLVAGAFISQFRVAKDVPGIIGPDEQAIRLILEREGENAENIHFVTAAQDNAPLWIYADIYGLPRKIFDKREPFNTVYALVNPLNDSYLGPVTLDDLLARFGPGNNFMKLGNPEILMEDPAAILYRFEGRERAIRKGYGEYPPISGGNGPE